MYRYPDKVRSRTVLGEFCKCNASLTLSHALSLLKSHILESPGFRGIGLRGGAGRRGVVPVRISDRLTTEVHGERGEETNFQPAATRKNHPDPVRGVAILTTVVALNAEA